MKLPAIVILAALSPLALSTPTSADSAEATVSGIAACQPDGTWSVDWTVTVPSRAGEWSILPGMYQDPRPWQSDSLPFTTTTTGHGDQADATIGIVYGWRDGPTGQWARGTTANPGCSGVADPTPTLAAVELGFDSGVSEPVITPTVLTTASGSKIELFRTALAIVARRVG
jgi:hypothetical protein